MHCLHAHQSRSQGGQMSNHECAAPTHNVLSDTIGRCGVPKIAQGACLIRAAGAAFVSEQQICQVMHPKRVGGWRVLLPVSSSRLLHSTIRVSLQSQTQRLILSNVCSCCCCQYSTPDDTCAMVCMLGQSTVCNVEHGKENNTISSRKQNRRCRPDDD